MGGFEKVLYILGLVALIVFAYMTLKQNPQWLSKENFGKSAYVMGILALLLIVFIGLCVFLLRR